MDSLYLRLDAFSSLVLLFDYPFFLTLFTVSPILDSFVLTAPNTDAFLFHVLVSS